MKFIKGDIVRLDKIQRLAARFITRDCKSRKDQHALSLTAPNLRREVMSAATDLPVQGSERAGTGNQHQTLPKTTAS